jgi:hypothetical protein
MNDITEQNAIYLQDVPMPTMIRPLIFNKILSAMADIKPIGKNQSNVSQNFKFRGIDDIYNYLHPILAKNGIFTITEVLSDTCEERTNAKGTIMRRTTLKIKYTLYAEDGSSLSGITIGEALDSGDKGANKAMAIAHKYFLTQLFTVPTEDMIDPDSESHEIVASKDIEEAGNVTMVLSRIRAAVNIEFLNRIYAEAKIHIHNEDYLHQIIEACKKRKAELSGERREDLNKPKLIGEA